MLKNLTRVTFLVILGSCSIEKLLTFFPEWQNLARGWLSSSFRLQNGILCFGAASFNGQTGLEVEDNGEARDSNQRMTTGGRH